MAKTKISEFSTTAGNNTDINSINIAEGCAPSGINDAIRELMRQLKEFQTGGAGDSVNSGGDFSVATNKFTVASASGNTAVAGTLAVTGTTTLTGALVANGNATLGDGSSDTVTVKGTPTLEVNPTLSGGTANGVLYLNGSKVATSGSALTFDGTALRVKNNGAYNPFFAVINASSTNDIASILYDQGTDIWKFINPSSYAGSGIDFCTGASNLTRYHIDTGGTSIWNVAGSEQMRLTSTGLGIGTSSPGYKLDVQNAQAIVAATSTTTTNSTQYRAINGGGTFYVGLDSSSGSNFGTSGYGAVLWHSGNYPMVFATNNTIRATLDSSGNLGLGVTPSAWGTAKAFQIGGSGFALSSNGAGSGDGSLTWNGYYNGTNWIYSYTGGVATRYRQNESGHAWYTAPSGTAGNAITFTQAMTLDASGNLLVGATSGNARISGYNAGLVGYFERTDAGGVAEFKNGSDAGYGIGFKNVAGSVVGSIYWTGSATTYATSSDYRLKNIIGNVTGSGARIDALEPIEYEWKASGERTRGFLAHKFQEVYPQSVTGTKDAVDADGNPVYQAMQASTSEVIADLVAEIQSLRKRLADAGIA